MPQVTIYTTSWCPHCEAAKRFLREQNITYEEHDVEESDEKWKEAMEKADGKDIVPVIDIDGEIFYGPWQEIKSGVREALDL